MQTLKKNSSVGDWILDKELGSGGQGVVWKVRYSGDKHSPPAALKICSDPSAKARSRFAREVALQREQQDPGIMCVRDTGEHNGAPYYVMELATVSLDRVITGDTAGTRLVRESGTLLLMFLRQACLALSNLHSHGILHRDIKPSNVLLMLDPPEPMKAVLADLGLAVLEEEQGRLTAVHEVVGTAIYRAPESLVGVHTPASDVYAFGKTLEFVFAGGLPSGVGPGRCSRSPLFANELWDCLDDVLHGACAFNPADRFKTAGELLAALPETIITRSALAKPASTPADTTLSAPEIVTLVSVIEACPATADWINPRSLREEIDLTAYQFALAFRRLIELDLVEAVEQTNDYGNAYTECRPTAAGVRWALIRTQRRLSPFYVRLRRPPCRRPVMMFHSDQVLSVIELGG